MIFLTIFSNNIYSQTDQIFKEIDEQVWKPFIEAYNKFDANKFNELHSDDVLRVNVWGIKVGNEYKESVSSKYAESKARGDKRSIQLWFEHRLVKTNNIAYEVGYYKINSIREGEERQSYGRFHVVLKKKDNHWKIIQDWDTNQINGHFITEEDFLKKDPLKF